MVARAGRRALIAASLGGCARVEAPAGPAGTGATVRLVSLGWHTEIVLAWPAEERLLPPFPAAPALGVAFGARDYFTAPDPGLAETLGAVLPGPAVILVSPRGAVPAIDAVALGLPQDGMRRLARFIAADLVRDAAGRPVLAAPGFASGAVFLAAVPAYALSYTCNTWALDALAAAGVPVSGAGIVTAGAAMEAARRAAGEPARS